MSEFSPSFDLHLKTLNSQIEQRQLLLKNLRRVYTKFPDICVQFGSEKKYIDPSRNNEYEYYSTKANALVDEFLTTTEDDYFIVEPYLIFNGFRIRSSPTEFHIGEYTDSGLEFTKDWQVKLLDNNISPVVIEKLQAYEIKHCTKIHEGNE